MADCDCDYCYKENVCQFAYDETNCREIEIQESKQIANDEFRDFFLYLKSLNTNLCNDKVEQILCIMRKIISDSEIKI